MKEIGIVGILILIIVLACSIFAARVGSSVGKGIEINARENAANKAQARQERMAWHRINVIEAERVLPYRIAAKQNALYWLSWFAIAAGATVIMAVAGGVGWWAVGFSRARVEVARREAYVIRIDPVTRQFPLLTYELNGVPRIYNPNTGSVIMLDAGRDETPMLVTGSAATQLAGAIAEKAAQARDGASVAAINPPLVID